jgi:GNAT superfamily N-acetyltransferase
VDNTRPGAPTAAALHKEADLERIPLTMCRETLDTLPTARLPVGYGFRFFGRNDDRTWARIETAAGEFSTTDKALARFRREFGGYDAELTQRCLFLIGPSGEDIGTAMGWFGAGPGVQSWGRLHWVGIDPVWQGRGLSKPLVAEALRILGAHHDRAYLTTQTTSAVAVKVYLDYGFVPCNVVDPQRRGWRLMAETLRHPALAGW